MAETNNKQPNFFARTGNKLGKWFREMKSELKKVVWPSSKQMVNNTLIVLAAVIVVGAIVFLFDWLASGGLGLLSNLFH